MTQTPNMISNTAQNITLSILKTSLGLWQPKLLSSESSSSLDSDLSDLSNSISRLSWSIPSDLSRGILTSNIAFILAKQLRKNPIEIAKELSVDLNQFLVDQNLSFVSQSVGAYINIVPTNLFYKNLLVQESTFDCIVEPKSERVMFEYIGANTAKQLHAGHMRNCNIGDSLRRVLSLKYENLITDNHWGDWGINMGIIIWGWKNYPINQESLLKLEQSSWQNKPLIEKLTEVYVWSNAQKNVAPHWDAMVRDEFLKLEQKDPINYELWQKFIVSTKKDLRTDLDLMRVPVHNLEQGESFYEPDMTWLTEFMNQHKIWKSEDKARFFDFEELAQRWADLDENLNKEFVKQLKNFGRAYLISSGGYTSYCYRDVAARLQWIRDYGSELMITVTDKTQKHNFDQAFTIICYLFSLPEFKEAVQKSKKNFQKNANQSLIQDLSKTTKQPSNQLNLNNLSNNLVHIGYGFLKLPDGKMSSRKGNVLLLRDLFAEVQQEAQKTILSKSPNMPKDQASLTAQKVALSAIKWNDLKQSYEQDITFDITQVLNFVGNTGVYQLYTYARLSSVLKKLQAKQDFKTDLTQTLPNERSQSLENSHLLRGYLQSGEVLFDSLTLNLIEQEILKQLFIFPDVLEQVCAKYQPHLICNYLYGLCNLTNKWYNDVPILKDTQRSEFMISFITKIMQNLAFTLDLLGIEVVDEI